MQTCPYCGQKEIAPEVRNCPSCGGYLGTTHQALAIGAVVADKYRIEGYLGQGGFGITYRARHISLRNLVAIKEYFPEGSSRQGHTVVTKVDGQKEFLEEGRRLSQLDHPGIVKVTDTLETNNTVYLVMQYIEGRSFKALLDERGSLPEKEAVGYIREVAQALKVVHEAQMLHQDIKPENLMLTNQNQVVLVDFGSSRQYAQDKTANYTRMVTPGYGPLEQYASRIQRGPYTDIYALGATLYSLLTGNIPPSAPERIENPVLEGLSCSERVKRTLDKAMRTRAAERHQNIDEFIADLQENDHQPTHNTNPTTSERLQPPHQTPGRKGSKPTALVVGAMIIGTLLYYSMRGQDEALSNSATSQLENPTQNTTNTLPPSANSNQNANQLPVTSTNRGVLTLTGHQFLVKSVVFSPTGSYLASGSFDNTIRLWGASGNSLGVIQAHADGVTSLAFSPDGAILASSSADGHVKLWDTQTGQRIQTIAGTAVGDATIWVHSLAFSPDGNYLVWGCLDGRVKVLDMAKRQVVQNIQAHSGPVLGVAFSPDGSLLATASHDTTVKLWNPLDLTLITTLNQGSAAVSAIAFSPDSRFLAFGGQNNVIWLWDLNMAALSTTLSGHQDGVESLSFAANGSLLISAGGENVVKIWEVSTGELKESISGHSDYVNAVVVSPDGTTLATASQDNSVRLWLGYLQ